MTIYHYWSLLKECYLKGFEENFKRVETAFWTMAASLTIIAQLPKGQTFFEGVISDMTQNGDSIFPSWKHKGKIQSSIWETEHNKPYIVQRRWGEPLYID